VSPRCRRRHRRPTLTPTRPPSAGFIAAHATLSSGDVDLCLVPEVDVVLRDGDGAPGGRAAVGCLHHIQRCVERNGHAVVVVAEGAGEELLGQSVAADAGGNRKLPKIGAFLKDEIASFFDEQGTPATIKYAKGGGAAAAAATSPARALLLLHELTSPQVHRPVLHGPLRPGKRRRRGAVHDPRAERGARYVVGRRRRGGRPAPAPH
jgi:hypothetical protein